MSQSPKPRSRVRGLALTTAVLAALASAPVLVGQVQAQSSQGTGNMQNMPGMSGGKTAAAATASANGTVEAVNASERKIKLNHEPIAAFSWPAMSMEFPAAASVDLSKVKPGNKVKFTVAKGASGTYTVESIKPAQ